MLAELRSAPDAVLAEPDIERLRGDWTASHPGIGIRIAPELHRALPALALPVYRVVYRVLQECLTNCVRHARATWVEMSWQMPDDPPGRAACTLIVENDRVSGSWPVDTHPKFGVSGMQERPPSVGGALQASLRGDRFRVELSIPATPAMP